MKNIISNINLRNIFIAVLFALIIPNIIIWLCIIFFQPPVDRAIFNIDYLLPLILYTIPRKPVKFLAILLFVLVYVVDMLVIVLQCLPYDMGALNFFYLMQDLMRGPSAYRNLFYLILFIGFIQFIVLIRLSVKSNTKSYLLLLILLCIILPILPKVSNSQVPYLINNVINEFSTAQDTMQLKPTEFKNMTNPWHTALKNGQPVNDRVLFILAESWGYANEAILEEQLKILKLQSDHFEYFRQGTNNSKKGTVVAELSELCNASFKDMRYLSFVRKSDGFDQCLPNLFSMRGYNTVSLEGSGVMYNQLHWYPIAGFKKSLHADNIGLPKNSIGGSAVADLDLIPFVGKSFEDKSQKLFYYWITYTSHQPFPVEEIKNYRFSCEKFNVTPDIDACRSMMLSSQFIDAVAELVTMPEMKGVEVLIVGDHSPLFIFKYNENSQFFDMTKVSWVHFKIKGEADITNE